MASRLSEIFLDNKLVEKIKKRLPYLFQIAELESSRAGKIGMQVGSLREDVIISLLIYKFGEENVETEIPITTAEVDVLVFKVPVSIKTITGKNLGGVKLIWTVDSQKAMEFRDNYSPYCDILLVQINWNHIGSFYYIPVESQRTVFYKIGRERYISLPKKGTNPRGVEFSKESLNNLIVHENTMSIPIEWKKTNVDFNQYKRWVELWRED